MAAFIAKQVVGDQLKSVTGAIGDKEEGEKNEETNDEEAAEIEEMRREAEEKRKEKHRKMEEERETMRQTIRDKYGLKKRVDPPPQEDPAVAGRIGRKKKTPEEMAADANADSDDELQNNSGFPKNLDELSSKVTDLRNNVVTGVSEVTEKCVLQ